MRPLGGNLGGLGGQKGSALEQVAALKNKYLHLNDGSSSEGGMQAYTTSVISTREYKRKRGEPWTVERVVFFEGMVY